MPTISSYALQYSNVDFSVISASTFDLFIAEADADNSPFIAPNLSDAQVATLTAQGRTIVGYVNVAVTDANRAYWQDSWTSAGPNPRDEDDLNPVAGSAPSWLQSQPTNAFGIIVDFTESAWQTIVINQAVALVQRGYSGVFLDDVGAYYTLGAPGGVPAIRLMANAMCQFVADIKAAITAVNPNAYVVVNSDPYLHTNVTTDAAGAQAAANYLAAVDAHLLENQSATAIDYGVSHLAGETRLILESDGTPAYSYADSWARGILYTADQGYDALGTFAYPATSGADTLSGGDGPNQISGLGGNDVIDGGGGADTMDGGAGNDTFYVDNAADGVIEGAGGGSDTIITDVSYTIGAGVEVELLRTYGSATTDAINLTGNGLANTIAGNAAANSIDGKAGVDAMWGYGGNDTYYVDNVGDTVIEAADGGSDIVIANVSYTLAAGREVETLRTYGSATTNAVDFTGNELANTLVGNAAVNQLDGKGGADAMWGYGGADSFAFTTPLGGGNVDAIIDFAAGTDKIALDDAIFAAVGAALGASEFRIGTAAADADDRIIYNNANGQLLYDADGVGGAAAVLFATLNGAPAISASDFAVI